MSLIPTPFSVVHIPRQIKGPNDPDTGNPTLVDQAPVTRQVQSLNQMGRHGSSREIISPDNLQRTVTTIHMAVPDPTLYQPHDQVVINAQFDAGGNYVTGTGSAFWVDGLPSDDRQGPWPQYLGQFGGLVKMIRVT